MGVDITRELCIFVATVVAGVLSGVLYDFFTVIGLKRKKLFISVSDIILSVFICALIISVFYIYNSFDLRWYMFIGLFLGLIIYFFCFERIFVLCLQKIIKLFDFIFKILLTPALFLYKILIVYLFKLARIFIAFLRRKLANILKKIKISRGKEKNERRNKKKHKKKQIKDNNNSSSSGGIIYADKGCYATASNNR